MFCKFCRCRRSAVSVRQMQNYVVARGRLACHVQKAQMTRLQDIVRNVAQDLAENIDLAEQDIAENMRDPVARASCTGEES